MKWERWGSEQLDLEELKIPTCFAPDGFEEPSSTELHHFLDAD